MNATWQASEHRLDVLDFLRGIAVLGIFVINIESFAYADAFSPWRYGFVEDLDRDMRFWTYFLFQGKFFSMFALLFGIGFYLFLERAARFGQGAVDIYAHRMFWLFVLGALHACLLWPGDILYHYAVCGLLLLPARSLRGWQLAACIAALMLLVGWQSVTSTSETIKRETAYRSALATQAAERSQEEIQTIERWEERHSPRKAMTPDESSPNQSYLHSSSSNSLCRVGRMALTNYLLQSVFAGIIFYGYGLGLHGSIPRSQLWPFILALWVLLLVTSVAWLCHFKQGPAEALWRWLMYATARPGTRNDSSLTEETR